MAVIRNTKQYKPINTLEMELALMKYLGIRTNLIVPNVSWGMNGLHECDILSLSSSNYATEIEIKVSKGDLINDKHKDHQHDHMLITYFYYAVPAKLAEFALTEIPEHAGLLSVEKVMYFGKEYLRVIQLKPAIRKKKAYKWTIDDRLKLSRLGTLRIYGLKSTINKLKTKKNSGDNTDQQEEII